MYSVWPLDFLNVENLQVNQIYLTLMNLSMQDIQLNRCDNYFTLRLKASKTPIPQRGSLTYFATEQSICPLQPMLAFVQTWLAMAAQPHDPLFTSLAGTPLIWAFVIDKLKILLSKLGYNPSLYSGHSFRVGAATTAAAANIPDHMIRTLGRWTSDCYCRYIRTSHESLQQAQQAMCEHFR